VCTQRELPFRLSTRVQSSSKSVVLLTEEGPRLRRGPSLSGAARYRRQNSPLVHGCQSGHEVDLAERVSLLEIAVGLAHLGQRISLGDRHLETSPGDQSTRRARRHWLRPLSRRAWSSTARRPSCRWSCRCGRVPHPVGAENAIQGPHAASSYSWRRPPSLSVLRNRAGSGVPVGGAFVPSVREAC